MIRRVLLVSLVSAAMAAGCDALGPSEPTGATPGPLAPNTTPTSYTTVTNPRTTPTPAPAASRTPTPSTSPASSPAVSPTPLPSPTGTP